MTRPDDSLLRLPDVIARVGLARSTIYDMIAKGGFPAPVKLGGRAVAWRASAIAAWIESLSAARANAGEVAR